MIRDTSKLQKSLSVFMPSAFGMIVYVFLAGLFIILNQFEDIKNVLELPASVDFSRIFAGWADYLLTSAIGQSRTETLVVGLFWALVGLAVYVFLRGLSRFILELSDNIEARRYVWPKGADRTRPLHALLEQAIFRMAVFLALAIVIFVPLAAVLRGPVFVDFLGPNMILQTVFWFLASALLWHIVVILLRLMALRARLIG